jgi:hypothetical protein
MTPSRSLLTLLACGALGVTLAACGASSGGGAAASTSASSAAAPASTSAPAVSASAASSSPAGSSAAASSIAANWTAFFDAKTPVAKRVSLLEDGPEFAAVIKSQAGGGLAAAATAKVTRVTVTSASQATVVYNILVAGQAALSNQSGTAVLQDGTWKVGLASFCGLLSLEAGGKTSGLPAPCKSAG